MQINDPLTFFCKSFIFVIYKWGLQIIRLLQCDTGKSRKKGIENRLNWNETL